MTEALDGLQFNKAVAQLYELVSAVEALALGSEKVQRMLDGNPPRKVIVVPDRLVNIVA